MIMIEMLTGRSPTLAPRGMVACPHALASEAGVEILKAGGSAVDVAIATSATLSVIYPHMTGLGGDAFWLIYDAKQNSVRYLDGAGSTRWPCPVPSKGIRALSRSSHLLTPIPRRNSKHHPGFQSPCTSLPSGKDEGVASVTTCLPCPFERR